MSENRRIIDARRRIWFAAPGWKIYADGVFPDLDDFPEIEKLEMELVQSLCIKDQTSQIILPGPEVSESYARLTDVLQKTTLAGELLFYDFDPQFIYEGSGIKSPRYKGYFNFVSLPQYLGQTFLSFLNRCRGHYIFFYHFDKQKMMLYVSEDTIQIKNAGRNEFMEVSLEANCWELE